MHVPPWSRPMWRHLLVIKYSALDHADAIVLINAGAASTEMKNSAGPAPIAQLELKFESITPQSKRFKTAHPLFPRHSIAKRRHAQLR